MASKRKFNKGPPPYKGWWNASPERLDYEWRWWDGFDWSIYIDADYPLPLVASCAEMKATRQNTIRWTIYWPTNARVPRPVPLCLR